MALNISSSHKVKVSFAIIFSVWWSFWGTLHLAIENDLATGFPKIIADVLVSDGLLAVFCLLIINNMSYYLPGRERYLYVLIVSVALSTIWLFLTKFILKALYKTDPVFMHMLSESSGIRYAFAFLMLVCMTMLSLLWYTQREQKDNVQRKTDTERLAREAELNKLRQQLQPHFLFNSLNSISALTGTQPEKARHMIQQLSDFLRGTLKKEEEQSTNFREELEYLQLYLDIEKVRFGYRLQTKIDYDPAILEMKLPPLLLQPLVENAIKFGLYDTIGEVIILIEAKNKNGMLEITVQNPFDETTALPVKGTGFGLSSIRRRLFLLFGRQDLLQLAKDGGQFTGIISIPQLL